MQRRDVLIKTGELLLFLATPIVRTRQASSEPPDPASLITIFLAGDVMTGRGIDQVLPHPGDPTLYEPYIKTAAGYVELAEAAHGPIPRPVPFAYIWGDALDELKRLGPDVRIVNLETAVTTCDEAWKGKGINYRMHPGNVACLTAAGLDVCALANNHVLDWGYRGLAETLATLAASGIATAGAGRDRAAARAPAVIDVPGKGRVIVFSAGTRTSGIPRAWAATDDRPGVDLLEDLDQQTVARIAADVQRIREANDVVVVSIHWGDNWGYEVPDEQRRFAHRLIDEAGADIVHGHSSHHPRGIEVYRDRPIFYGCGDLINDYEGIRGHEAFRSELGLMYFVTVDAASGRLVAATMTPTRMRRFSIVRPEAEDTAWMHKNAGRLGRPLGTRVTLGDDGTLTLGWGQDLRPAPPLTRRRC